MIYRFESQARQTSTIVKLLLLWGITLCLWVALDATLWIVAGLALFSLPVLWDVVRNTTVELEVWPGRIVWSSSLKNGDRADIDHVRLNRRFDGSMKITLVHVGGSQTRLPPDVSPPIDAFETALKDAGIAVQRHPFSLIG